jgi:hypothetical protein
VDESHHQSIPCSITRSVLYEPDWLGDSRTWFTDGAFVLVRIGEPRFRSETASPGVSTTTGDISQCEFESRRFFPPLPSYRAPADRLSEARFRGATPTLAAIGPQLPPNSLVATRECLSELTQDYRPRTASAGCGFSRTLEGFRAFRAVLKKARLQKCHGGGRGQVPRRGGPPWLRWETGVSFWRTVAHRGRLNEVVPVLVVGSHGFVA